MLYSEFQLSTSVVHAVNLRGSRYQPPWFMMSTSVVHRVNLRGSRCQLPWFMMSTSVVHVVNLRSSTRNFHTDRTSRNFLTDEEVMAIDFEEFCTAHQDLVRDVFLFSYFAGLVYIDVRNLAVYFRKKISFLAYL